MKTQIFKHRSHAALSSLCWGVYMILNGISMIIQPNSMLETMGFEPTVEIWIRMAGLLALVLGYYYVQMGRYHFLPFYTWKIIGHIAGIIIMTTFYLQGLAPGSILMLCLGDMLAALWTAWGIFEDRKRAIPAAMT
ncbi:hypothetical protein WJR50_14770 [Catalinimonas sp. 4WD22]|uniref:hypothetical protein n=1 Tax=Catalinimonas locisalis TaxID=3133978 RepID=UPI003100D47C